MSGSIAAAGAAATSQSSAISQAGTTALGSLTDNFSTFLSMLMTQLKNQDPSSPMDSSSFTTELVQFSSVEQQISTNTNLTQLIQLTQASQVEQSSALIGKQVTVNSTQIGLQNGAAQQINYNTPNAEPITISIVNAAGVNVATAAGTSSAGANSWTWNGKDGSGNALPDGSYKVTVSTATTAGAASPVPFTVTGTATSVQNNAGVVQLQMGGLTVPFSAVQSVGQ